MLVELDDFLPAILLDQNRIIFDFLVFDLLDVVFFEKAIFEIILQEFDELVLFFKLSYELFSCIFEYFQNRSCQCDR